jgi:hypothetical protein
MAEDQHDDKVGPGRPPLHTRSLAPGLSAKQRRKRSLEIMATALEWFGAQGHLVATGGWHRRAALY